LEGLRIDEAIAVEKGLVVEDMVSGDEDAEGGFGGLGGGHVE